MSAHTDDQTPLARLTEAGMHHVVGYQLAQAAITTTQVFVELVGEPFDLRPVEFTMLNLIHENPDVSARQLARALAVTPPNITVWIDRLEKRGLVKRERSRTDARAQHIRATAAGAALARKSLAGVLEGEREALGELSAAERAMLVELLHKVARSRKRAA
ncbi:MarR family winged helix-turn-helix transcriptional regulator [Sphaerotilaceae bacterium SBD11-9]